MALRTTTTDGLSGYDNPNELRNAHGYDVLKGSRVGYEAPKKQPSGKACYDMDIITDYKV